MSHFTSEQLPSGSPAMLDEPQAPLKADVAPVPPPVDVDPVPPAEPPLPLGAVGVNSFVVFSNAQPVARVDASRMPKRQNVFMTVPYSPGIGTRSPAVHPYEIVLTSSEISVSREGLETIRQNAVQSEKQ